MSGYKVFAIAGATGKVGKAMLDELLEPELGLEVRIITRQQGGNAAANAEELEKRGAKMCLVDYDNKPTLVRALKGVDVVISCLGATGLPLQLVLAKASAIAGAKLYVNSHWGAPMDEYRTGLTHMAIKDQPIKIAEKFGLPWTYFRVGIFPEFTIHLPLTELNLKSRKSTIYGTGNTPNSWTTIPDVARYAVYVLTHLPPNKLANRVFNIEGDRKTFSDVVHLYAEKYPGEPMQVTYKPVSTLEDMVTASGGKDFFHALMIEYSTGRVAHDPSKLDNAEYPEWKPKKVSDVL